MSVTRSHGASSPSAFVRSALLSTRPSTRTARGVLVVVQGAPIDMAQFVPLTGPAPAVVQGEMHQDLAA